MVDIENRDISGTEGYFVTSSGEVWSKNRVVFKTRYSGEKYPSNMKGRKLKPWLSGPYLYCILGSNGPKTSVHRLVCRAFHGQPAAGQEVSHLDGNPLNNNASNLEWATHSENEQQKRQHGTYARPIVYGKPWQKKRGPKVSLHPQSAYIIDMLSRGATTMDVATNLGMSKSGAHNVIKNRLNYAE